MRADSLEELCGGSEVLVVHAGLTEETRRSIGAEHLAALPDGGVVVNTARGDLFDQEAISHAQAQKGIDDLVPLATVGPLENGGLPFGPDSVNLVLLGPDTSITPEEVHRVLAPGGLYLSGPADKLVAEEEPEDAEA